MVKAVSEESNRKKTELRSQKMCANTRAISCLDWNNKRNAAITAPLDKSARMDSHRLREKGITEPIMELKMAISYRPGNFE